MTNMKLKLKNEHFHIERRFMDKATYLKEHFPPQSVISLQNITLSQNFTTHFSDHENLKKLVINSSFGDLIPASALLDTGSAESKFLLKELESLRKNIVTTPYFKKNYGTITDTDLEKAIAKAKADTFVRDYTMLLMFEKIVKLACEFQNYMKGKDNCNLSELQSKIAKAKNLLETQKFPKIKKQGE